MEKGGGKEGREGGRLEGREGKGEVMKSDLTILPNFFHSYKGQKS